MAGMPGPAGHARLPSLERPLTERGTRFFVAAICRQLWHLLPDQQTRHAVEVAEDYAHGLADAESLEAAWGVANLNLARAQAEPLGDDAALLAVEAVLCATWETPPPAELSDYIHHVVTPISEDVPIEQAWQADVLRCLFNPLAGGVAPPSWNAGAIVEMVQAVNEPGPCPRGCWTTSGSRCWRTSPKNRML
jgi:hypothetical protein